LGKKISKGVKRNVRYEQWERKIRRRCPLKSFPLSGPQGDAQNSGVVVGLRYPPPGQAPASGTGEQARPEGEELLANSRGRAGSVHAPHSGSRACPSGWR